MTYARHRIAACAGHLHVDEFEQFDGNGNTILQTVYRLSGDEDGYHMATLLGAWIGDAWHGRAWFCERWGTEHIEKCESIVGDAFDQGAYPNEPKLMPKGEK